MTPKEFAKMCRDAQACHEQSYDYEYHKYETSYAEAAKATCPKEWATIIACLLTQGYSDVWDWCEEVEQACLCEQEGTTCLDHE